VSDDAGAAPPPYVLDVSTLTAVARGDAGVMILVQVLDGQGRRLVVPVLAVAAALLDTRSDRRGRTAGEATMPTSPL
jgi:hypothetical protein